jgi:hypothetical protein
VTLNIELAKRRLADFRPQAVNARTMKKETWDRLVANIRTDGRLTSVPLIYEPDPATPGDIVSGHHRIGAAIEALGDEHEDFVMLVRDEQSLSEVRARQISHNAVEGYDDLATLKQQYEEIEDVDWRQYAGLDDKTLELLAKVDLEGFSELNLDFTTVTLLFLPHELQRARTAFEQARQLGRSDEWWAARLDQHQGVLDALETTHQSFGVGNVATALELIVAVFERSLTATRAGWVDEDGEATRKGAVPVESVLGSRTIPSDAAAVIVKAIRRMTRDGDVTDAAPWRAVELWAADYLAGQ